MEARCICLYICLFLLCKGSVPHIVFCTLFIRLNVRVLEMAVYEFSAFSVIYTAAWCSVEWMHQMEAPVSEMWACGLFLTFCVYKECRGEETSCSFVSVLEVATRAEFVVALVDSV